VITAHRKELIAGLATAGDESSPAALDGLICEAYRRLDPAARQERAADLAWYLLDRGRAPAATRFLRPLLHDGDTVLWWKFDLMIAYGWAFLLAGRYPQARAIVDRVKGDLRRMREARRLPEDVLHRHELGLACLDGRLRTGPVAE
jgi:hypothetical protein